MSSETVGKHQSVETDIELFESLQRIQEDINTAIDLQDVLDRILRGAVTLVGARDGSLMLIEEDKLRFRARFGGSLPEGKVERTFKPGEGIAGWVVENRKPYLCHDTNLDERFDPIIGGVPIRSLVSVPIISYGTVLGVINVDSTESNRFSGSDAQLLVNLAGQTAAAIERAELWDSLRQMVEKTAGGTKDLYQHIVNSVHRLTRCPVAMWQVDEKNRTQATIRAHRGLRGEYAKTRVLDLRDSVTGRVIQAARPIEVEDIEEDLDISPETKVEARQQGWQSMLIVPLLAGFQQAVGTLSIYSCVKKKFAPWETDLLYTFASQAGMAVQNATRLQTIQQLNQVGQSLTTLQISPDVLGKTLERIANAALEVLGADIVDLYQYRADIDRFELPPIMVGERNYPDIIPRRILPDDVVVKIVCSGEAIYASNAQVHEVLASEWESPREGWPEERFVVREEVLSSAAVPMKVDEEILGILFASYRQKRDFDSDLELRERIEIFARQGAIAISNARQVQESRERADQLERLQNVSALVSAEPFDLEKVLRVIVENLGTILPEASCAIRLYDSRTDEFEPQIGTGVLEDLVERSPRTEGTSRYVVQTKSPRYLEGSALITPTDGGPPSRKSILDEGVQAAAYLPLIGETDVIGVLYVDLTTPHRFSPSEKQVLELFADQAAIAIDNTRRRLKDIGALQKVNEAIATAPWTEIAALISQKAKDLTQSEYSGLWAVEGSRLIPGAMYGTELMDVPELPINETSINGWVAKTGKPYVCFDVDDDPHYQMWREDVQSSMAVPLKWRGEVIGTLAAESVRKDAFSSYQIELLQTLANQAAIAIRNTQIFRALDERAKRLVQLQKVTSAISAESLDLEKLLQLVTTRLSEIFFEAPCAIRLFDSERNEFGSRVSAGPLAEYWWDLPPRPDGTSWHVVTTRALLYVEDIELSLPNGYPAFREEFKGLGIRAFAHLPLITKEETVTGVLYVELTSPHQFSKDDKLILSLFADQAAIAIENARLYQNLERRIRELEVLTEIGHTVSNLGIDQILDFVYEKTGKIVNLSDAQVQIAFYSEDNDEVNFPLAVERDDGVLIDVVRWSRREAQYRKPGEDEIVSLFLPRVRRDPPGLNEHVIRTREPLLITGEPDRDFEQKAEELGIWVWPTFGRLDRPTHSWLGVPMMVGGRVTGVISIQSLEQEHEFDQDHIGVLTSIANQAAVAIENARLYENLETTYIDLEREQHRRISAEKFGYLGVVAAGLAHRLNSVAGMVRLCERELRTLVDLENEQVCSNLDTISEEIEYMLTLAEGLFTPTEALEEKLFPTDLRLLLKDAVNNAHIPKGIKLITAHHEGLLLVPANKWFVEMFVEIIKNSIKAMNGEGKLEIGTRPADDDWVEVWVSDTGCGIHPEDHERIFELFYAQREKIEGEPTRGFGFGLWWIKTFLIGIGGSIDYESEVGMGTTFLVRLPA